MQRDWVNPIIVAVWSSVTILGLTWGTTLNWPDYLHVNYGVPFVWATHTLNTIAGPVDVWKVDLQSLTIDLLIWLGLMLVFVIVSTLRMRS